MDYAASLAGYVTSSDYKVVTYPAQLTQAEQLLQMFSSRKEEPTILADTPFESFEKAIKDLCDNERTQVYARLPYDIEIR